MERFTRFSVAFAAMCLLLTTSCVVKTEQTVVSPRKTTEPRPEIEYCWGGDLGEAYLTVTPNGKYTYVFQEGCWSDPNVGGPYRFNKVEKSIPEHLHAELLTLINGIDFSVGEIDQEVADGLFLFLRVTTKHNSESISVSYTMHERVPKPIMTLANWIEDTLLMELESDKESAVPTPIPVWPG